MQDSKGTQRKQKENKKDLSLLNYQHLDKVLSINKPHFYIYNKARRKALLQELGETSWSSMLETLHIYMPKASKQIFNYLKLLIITVKHLTIIEIMNFQRLSKS